jgi:hypothetical protein
VDCNQEVLPKTAQVGLELTGQIPIVIPNQPRYSAATASIHGGLWKRVTACKLATAQLVDTPLAPQRHQPHCAKAD